MNVIITLAGKSLRFAKEGIKKDKFLLSTGKNSIVLDHVVQMFNPDDVFHLQMYPLSDQDIDFQILLRLF